MNKFLAFLCFFGLLAPAFANAQSSSDLQSQAQALLQQVAQLQAQLAAQGQGTSQTGTSNSNVTSLAGSATTAAAAPSACPNIGRVLKKGSSGEDVTRLQQYLALDASVYPEGTVSGYYGALTEKAVQRWQAKYNIVSSGTAASTGYGVVGPRTAAAIALLCSTGASSPVGGYIQVSPISGNAPLNVNVIATVNTTNSCAGAMYALNWGDGAAPTQIPVSANNCQQVSQTYTHSYTAGGTYQIILQSGAHQTSATITVYGGQTTTGTQNTQTQAVRETFVASPQSGATPLTVTFSGMVTGADQGWCSTGCSDILVFGDGSQAAVPLPLSQTGSQNYSISHQYTTQGTYTATLYQGQSGSGRPTVGSVVITVGGGGSSNATLQAPALTPAVGGNPNAVSLAFDFSQATCNYQVQWGDGFNDNSTGGCSGSSVTSKTLTHTYASGGSYTISLFRDGQKDTVGVTISQ